ncbi:MAG TPA: DUF5667 domain-containing protein [Anaerolineaceae bacterium]|nr:DUF5667 domain-containing protein [Anaerolineaceae bacterium]
MFSIFATIMIVVSLVLGGGGAVVQAAQSSQPDQSLYRVKLWSEDAHLSLTTDPQTQYQLALEFSTRRVEEIQYMLQAGNDLPEAVLARYQNQLEQTIRYASNLPVDQALQALEQIRTRLQTQQQTFLQIQSNGSANANASLTQSRQMVQEQLRQVEEGLADPVKLREQIRQRDQQREQDPQNPATPQGEATQADPGSGNGNPWTSGTPTPGSGYGPGDCVTCTPSGNGQGSNPWTTGTPTPGSSYGPGPGTDPNMTCTPGSSYGPGPQTTPSGQGPLATPSGSGGQPTSVPGGPGGNHLSRSGEEVHKSSE